MMSSFLLHGLRCQKRALSLWSDYLVRQSHRSKTSTQLPLAGPTERGRCSMLLRLEERLRQVKLPAPLCPSMLNSKLYRREKISATRKIIHPAPEPCRRYAN